MNPSLTAPAVHPASALPTRDVVNRLRDSDIFRQYQKAFQTATGLPLVLRTVGSYQAPLQGSKAINPLCALMAANSRSCAACLRLQEQMETARTHGTGVTTRECFAGLTESIVPIRIGDQVVAYLQTGQVLLRPPTEAGFQRTARLLATLNPKLGEAALRAAYFATRVMTRSLYAAHLQLLASFAQHLSLLSNELMISEAAAEPPMIARARTYISEHLDEDLTLGRVAGVVHVSTTYFCKLFKGALGINFTDYVARVRIELVKQLLLNPHKRVSEAAYQAGFQSLSQFNRVFRRVAGEAPSLYREHLHSALPGRHRPPLTLAA